MILSFGIVCSKATLVSPTNEVSKSETLYELLSKSAEVLVAAETALDRVMLTLSKSNRIKLELQNFCCLSMAQKNGHKADHEPTEASCYRNT